MLTTFKGKGLIPDDHPLAGGVLGRSGTPVASWLMNESDVLVVYLHGTGLDRWDFVPMLRALRHHAVAPTLYGFEPVAPHRLRLPLSSHLTILREWLRAGSLLRRLTRESGDVDLHVVRAEKSGGREERRGS